jgi:hypothetical protein
VRGIALAALVACALPAAAQFVVPQPAPQAVVPQPPPQLLPYDKPQGIYATIDQSGTASAIRQLGELIPTPRREAIAAAIASAPRLAPPVLYALANAIAQDDASMSEAVFWYHVGRIRAVYDGLRCKDPSARNAVVVLGKGLNPDLTRFQRQNRQRTLQIAELAIKWDQQHPRDYDHRWINLYGKVARYSAGTDPSELTVPESDWPAILQRVHDAHLKSVQEFAAQK